VTHDAIKIIEEKINKDHSLSEERKKELRDLLSTMKPEMENLSKSQLKYAERMIPFSKDKKVDRWKKNK
jgi:hypothetical protein